jgi:beta-N-acetylhexosaminidase
VNWLKNTALFLLSSLYLHASWAQNTLEQMTLDEKIGQLFMLAAYVDEEYAKKSLNQDNIIEEIAASIEKYHVGGLAFVGPSFFAKQVALTNRYQQISKYPLLIAQDLEWGLAMRIKDALSFPKNITLGAVSDELIYTMGKEISRQAKLIGVHMNLSPVLDVNIEPENLAINVRSFGASPQLVAEKGVAMIRGMQEGGIIASAKHFPGLGDITIDPHLDLPVSRHSRQRFQAVEFYPFVEAIKAGVMSIQTEHLLCQELDGNNPASLSPKIVTDILKKELEFEGLVVSGALRMKALTNYLSDEEIAVKAFLAGSDLLLMPRDLPKAFAALQAACADGTIDLKEIDARVLKILRLKEGIKKTVAVPKQDELCSSFAKALKASLYAAAVRPLRGQIAPCTETAAFVQLGEAANSNFITKVPHKEAYYFSFEGDHTQELQRLLQKMESYTHLILAVYPADPRRIEQIRMLSQKNQQEEFKQFRVHGLPRSLLELASALQPYHQKITVAYFGNPFGLPFFDGFSTLIMGYEADPDAEEAVAKILLKL